jgi:hypothetical protein
MSRAETTRRIYRRAMAERTVQATFGGETYDVLSGGVSQDVTWQIQGYRAEYNFSIWIEADIEPPAVHSTILVDGKTRRVLGVRPDAIGALIRVDLGGKYAGA